MVYKLDQVFDLFISDVSAILSKVFSITLCSAKYHLVIGIFVCVCVCVFDFVPYTACCPLLCMTVNTFC